MIAETVGAVDLVGGRLLDAFGMKLSWGVGIPCSPNEGKDENMMGFVNAQTQDNKCSTKQR